MVADIGTGDGRAVLARAAAAPGSLVLGIDSAASAMVESSRRAARRGPSNAIFLAAGADTLVDSVLKERVDLVTVSFPWGSLLRGVVGLDLAALAGVAALVAPGGRLRLLASVVPSDGVDGISSLDSTCEPEIRAAWARAGLDLISMRPTTMADIAASRSSWARRLASGPDTRSVWRFELCRPCGLRHPGPSLVLQNAGMGHVVLVGLMGSGKSTVGAELAAALGVAHRDSDLDIQRETGLQGRDIAARDGIDALHAMESRHLLEALSESGMTIISAAASTLDDPACRPALRDSVNVVVWLQADPAVVAARLRHDDHRPDLGHDLDDVITRQATERDHALHDVADLTLDATEPPATLVATIVARLHAVG